MDDRYLIGVDGDVFMEPIPNFKVNPTCEGIDNLQIDYWALQRNGVPLPENVFFYPDTRQFRVNSNNFAQEGMLEMDVIGAVNYFIVPTTCGPEELPLTYDLNLKYMKVKAKKEGSNSKKSRRNLRKFDDEETRMYAMIDSNDTASEKSDDEEADSQAQAAYQGETKMDKKQRVKRRRRLGKDPCDTDKTNKTGCPPNNPCLMALEQKEFREEEARKMAEKPSYKPKEPPTCKEKSCLRVQTTVNCVPVNTICMTFAMTDENCPTVPFPQMKDSYWKKRF